MKHHSHGQSRDDVGRFAAGGEVDRMAGGGDIQWDDPPAQLDGGIKWDDHPAEPDAGKLSAAWQGAKAGATFNFNDEIAGARAASPKLPGTNLDIPEFVGPIPTRTIAGAGRLGLNALTGKDPDAVAQYEKARDEERHAQELAKQQHPYIHMAGEVAGSLPSMAALPELGLAKGAGLGARMAQGAVTGAEYGGLSGLGQGKDTGDRAMEAAQGIVSGIIGGGVAPLAGAAAGAAYDKFARPAVNTVRGWVNPEAEAARRLSTALRADQDLIQAGKAEGMSPQEWAAARAAGEPVTLAELGSTNTQALLRSAANTSPEGRAILEKTINDRFAGQSERVADEARNLVAGGANAGKTSDQLVAEYDVGRGPLYKQAFSKPAAQQMWTPELEQIAQAPVVQNAIRMANVTAKNEAAKIGMTPMRESPFAFDESGRMTLRSRPDGSTVTPNLQYWDAVKKNLDQMGGEGRAWAKTLRDHLDESVPEYGHARGFAANFFGERDALEAGRSMAGKRMDPQMIRDAMRKMKPDERELFREGYASDWANRVISNVSDTRDITKAMFNSPNERARAMAVFGPAGMAKMQARMSLETIMDGARRAMGNSTTARQLIEAGLAGGAVEGYATGWDPQKMMLGAAGAAGARAGLAHAAVAPIAAGAKKLIGKVDAKTARLVAELLTSNDPTKLSQGLRMAQKNQRIADGLKNMATSMALAGAQKSKVIPRVPVDTTGWGGSMPARADDEQNKPVGPIQ